MNKGKGSGAIILAIIIGVIAAIAIFTSKGSVSGIFKTLGWIIGIAVLVLVLLAILLIIFSNKAGNKARKDEAHLTSNHGLENEQKAIIQNGRSNLMEVRRTLLKIHEPEITGKGNEICAISDKILQTLKDKPDKLTNARQFINYYLPTLNDVLVNYEKLASNNQITPDMTQKVVNYLNEVFSATNKLFDNLFKSDNLDMTVDMESMSIILRRDGLIDDENNLPSHKDVALLTDNPSTIPVPDANFVQAQEKEKVQTEDS